MTSRDFCYWLQGYFEIGQNQPRPAEWSPNLNSEQIQCIKNHLAMVFKHEIDPSHGDKAHQDKLSDVHSYRDKAIKDLADAMGKIDTGNVKVNC